MSHFLRIQTQLREREHLLKALEEVNVTRNYGYRLTQGQNLIVRGYAGQQERAEIVVHASANYDIGFRRQNEAYEMVADWWGVERNSPIRKDTFVPEINYHYNYSLILDQLRNDDRQIEENHLQPDGRRIIIARIRSY